MYIQVEKWKKQEKIFFVDLRNYLQDTQQNIYFFEWRGNARRALASTL